VIEVLAAGQLLEQHQVAGEVAHPTVDSDAVPSAVQPEQAGFAAGRPLEVEQGTDDRRLPGAVGAQEPEDRALLHGEGDVVDPARRPVPLRQVDDLDDLRHDRPRR
jgi:hypothetical protein